MLLFIQGRPGERGPKGQPGEQGTPVSLFLPLMSYMWPFLFYRVYYDRMPYFKIIQGGPGGVGPVGPPGLAGARVCELLYSRYIVCHRLSG